jgi:hypothetical protein
MNQLLDFLNQGWVGSAIGIGGIIIGALLGVYFYRRSRQGAQIAYHYKTVRVLGAMGHTLPEAVKITFRNRQINNLCRTLILVWNNSDKTIYGANIVKEDPLRIRIGKGALVLDARIVKVTREVNKWESLDIFSIDPAETNISFDYLDAGDGCVIETFHTESNDTPILLGSIHEMPKGFLHSAQRDMKTLAGCEHECARSRDHL